MASASATFTEEEEQFASLLQPIRELTKTGTSCWDLEIASQLEKYIDYIAHVPIEINVNGDRMKLDFVKAALVVQNSVHIYSKKVENLWLLLQETMEFLSSRSSNRDNPEGLQAPRGGARRRAPKRRQKGIDINLLEPVNLKFRRPNQLIKKKTPEKNLQHPMVPRDIFQLEEALNSAQNPIKIQLYSRSNEPLDFYPSDLRSNFLFDPVSFYLKIDGSPITDLGAINSAPQADERPFSPEAHHGSLDELIDDEPPNVDWQNDFEDPLANPVDQHVPEIDVRLFRHREYLLQIPTPSPVVYYDPWQGMNPYFVDEESSLKPCGSPIKIYLPEPLRKRTSRKRKGVGKNTEDSDIANTGIDEFLGQVERSALDKKLKTKSAFAQPDDEFLEDFLIFCKTAGSKKRKQCNLKRDEVAEDIVDNDNDFVDQQDDANNYDDPPNFGEMNDDDDIHHFDHPETDEPSSSSGVDELYFQLIEQSMKEYTASAQNFIQQTESTKRVQAWHDLIQPRLQEAESRKEFDIHLYGSNILETFGNEEPFGSVINFSQIVGREPKNELARYFLATLQLANTYNVEIVGRQGDLDMDGVQLKLLSLDRHHEHLDNFKS